jgi:hypothetical protein
MAGRVPALTAGMMAASVVHGGRRGHRTGLGWAGALMLCLSSSGHFESVSIDSVFNRCQSAA